MTEVCADGLADGDDRGHQGYDRRLAPMVVTVHLADVERLTRLIATSPAGRTAVCHDIDADPTIWRGQAALITGAGVGFHAFVAVPLRKADARVAILAMHSIAPRRWTDEEVALIEETAARTSAAVQRSHADAALVDSSAPFWAPSFLIRWRTDEPSCTRRIESHHHAGPCE